MLLFVCILGLSHGDYRRAVRVCEKLVRLTGSNSSQGWRRKSLLYLELRTTETVNQVGDLYLLILVLEAHKEIYS